MSAGADGPAAPDPQVRWTQALGGVVYHFAEVEAQALALLRLLCDEEAFETLRWRTFTRRVKTLLALLRDAPPTDAALAGRARALLRDALRLVRRRNRVIHNPILPRGGPDGDGTAAPALAGEAPGAAPHTVDDVEGLAREVGAHARAWAALVADFERAARGASIGVRAFRIPSAYP